MFSLVCTWINGCVNIREAGDLRRHRAHFDVTVKKLAHIYGRIRNVKPDYKINHELHIYINESCPSDIWDETKWCHMKWYKAWHENMIHGDEFIVRYVIYCDMIPYNVFFEFSDDISYLSFINKIWFSRNITTKGIINSVEFHILRRYEGFDSHERYQTRCYGAYMCNEQMSTCSVL